LNRLVSRRRLLGSTVALGGLWLGAGLAPTATAHRAHVTLTRLLANRAAGNWELIHSIHYHDAAVALRRLAPGQGLQPGSAAGQARLMLEIETRIAWFDPQATPLRPKPVGAELSGDAVVLYQELATPILQGRYQVRSTFLHDVFAAQRNNFSIELAQNPLPIRLNAAQTTASFEVS
jgi:hypothetical protein